MHCESVLLYHTADTATLDNVLRVILIFFYFHIRSVHLDIIDVLFLHQLMH